MPAHPASTSSGRPDALALYIAIIAVGMSILSIYISFYGEKPLSPGQQEMLQGISADLRALQNKELRISAPVDSTIYLDKQYPVKDMFPAQFDIPLEFAIPINTQLVGMSTSGQPVSFRVEESVPIKVKVPVSSAKAFGNSTVQIKKDIPVKVEMTSSVKVGTAYRQELNSIIDRLDKLSGTAN
jgi:hypothetical protein